MYFVKIIIVKTVSATTIGKVIRRNDFFYKQPEKIYHNPNRKRCKKKVKTRVYQAPKHNQGYVEV